MDTPEPHSRRLQNALYGGEGGTVRDIEAELGVGLPGADEPVRFGVYARRRANQYVDLRFPLLQDFAQQIQLEEIVHDDMLDAGVDGGFEFGAGFVVAM